MIRVILDTNVIVSAYLKERGREALVVSLAFSGAIALYLSPQILAEYEGVLERKQFSLDPDRRAIFVAQLRESGRLTRPTRKLSISPDPADNRFLECAEAVGADFLVTGNKRHFPKRWGKTRVVNTRELLEFIGDEWQ